MNTKQLSIAGVILAAIALAAAAGCDKADDSAAQGTTATPATADAQARCEHEIKRERCPFCTPELVESEGFCGEHGVAEALCAQCRPYLKAAFRAKGDWCAEHNGPDSQCMVCHPELEKNIRPGEHGAPMGTAPGA